MPRKNQPGCPCCCRICLQVRCYGVAIAGASVAVTKPDGSAVASGTTAADGTFCFTGIAGQTYLATIAASGYPTRTVPVVSACNRTIDVDLCGAPCGNCLIPRQDLTVSWTNLILGNGQATLAYSGFPTTQWLSECTYQLLHELVCTQNQIEFRVYYFISGACPDGQSQYCSTVRANPFRLVQTGLTCGANFLLTCQVTSLSCPNLASNGYTSFTASV